MTNSLGKFQKWLEDQNKSPFTVRGYVRDVQQFLRWCGSPNGSLPGDAFSEDNARRYVSYLLDERNSKPRTFNRKLAALRSFVMWLEDISVLDCDPFGCFNMIREERSAPPRISHKEKNSIEKTLATIVDKASDGHDRLLAIRDRALVYTLLNTGIRLSEICALDVCDINISPDKGALKVRNQSLKRRVIPLNSQAREALQYWLDVRPETSSQAVFIEARPGGSRLSRRAVQGRISKIGKAARVTVTANSLRHTVARQLLDAGEELETVAKLLGHRDLNSTRQYISRSESDLEKAVNLL